MLDFASQPAPQSHCIPALPPAKVYLLVNTEASSTPSSLSVLLLDTSLSWKYKVMYSGEVPSMSCSLFFTSPTLYVSGRETKTEVWVILFFTSTDIGVCSAFCSSMACKTMEERLTIPRRSRFFLRTNGSLTKFRDLQERIQSFYKLVELFRAKF